MTPPRLPARATLALGVALVLTGSLVGLLQPLASVGTADPWPPSDNIRLDSESGASLLPELAADSWGRVHAVWQEDRTGTYGVHYSRSPDFGESWEPDRRLDALSPGVGYEPDVAVDLGGGPYNGSVYVVWRTTDAGTGDIRLVRSPDGGVSWNPPVVVDGGPSSATSHRPRIALGTGGTVFVTWFDNRDPSEYQVFFRTSADAGMTWSPEVQLSTSGTSSFNAALAAQGDHVYVAWISTDLSTRYSLEVAASADGGVTWRNVEVVSRYTPETIRGFDIAADMGGALHVAWIDSDLAARQTVRYVHSADLGSSFAPSVTVAGTLPGVSLADVRAAVVGPVLAVAWSDARSGDFDVYYAWSDGGSWSAPIRVDDTDRNADPTDDASVQNRPGVAGAGSALYIAWSDTRGGSLTDIYTARAEWSRVLITEIRDAPDGQEFIELYGWSRTPVSLAGWTLDVDGVTFDLGVLGAIAPGAYAIAGDIPDATLYLPLNLGEEGSRVQVVDSSAIVVDDVGYGIRGVAPDPHPGRSTARYGDGVSYGRSWTWGDPASPGTPNRVPPPVLAPSVVLNEVLFNPSSPDRRFAELYYRGATATRVSGLRVVGDSVADLGSIDFSPSQRYHHLFYADAPSLFSSLDMGGDNVYLADDTGRLWDEVGWTSPHAPDRSVVRVREGEGSHDGFDDLSSVAAGWAFDMNPSLPGISVGPDQSGFGDLGEAVAYSLTVTNDRSVSEDIELELASGPVGWRVDLREADGITPITDSNGNGLPDLLGVAAGEGRAIVAVVHVPSASPIGDTELTTVTGFAFSNIGIRGSAQLATATAPHVEPRKWATPTTIYVEGTPPPLVTETTIHLELVGSGQAIERLVPQDTIFLIDSSGSMTAPPWNSDPMGMRIDAIRAYIDGMRPSDRAAIVGFAQDPDYGQPYGAWLTNDVGGGAPAHLTWMDAGGKALAKGNAETMRFGFGGTNIEKALQIAHRELLPAYRPGPACFDYARPFPEPPAGGIPDHTWVEILLTDGLPSHGPACTDDEVGVAAANNIRIFTIGLGDYVDQAYLQDMATRTGGKYFEANAPSDLLAIYTEIGTFISRIAGYDDDVTDDLPMVHDVVPADVNLVADSFVDPVTLLPKPPDWRMFAGGRQTLQWNVSQLDIGDVWSVEYRVSTSRTGIVPVSIYPEARVTYLRWDGAQVTLSFPPAEIEVLDSPPPRVVYTITRFPDRGTVSVDGVPYSVPVPFVWNAGETHEISVPTVDSFGPRERDRFDRWGDGGAPTHTITVGYVDTSVTAYFVTQVRPTVVLLGTDQEHSVTAWYTFHRQPSLTTGVSGAWSDWLDQGTSLSFDALAVGSGPEERWLTVEDFGAPPWTFVPTGFTREITYFHQARATLRTTGLSPAAPARITALAFGDPSRGSTSGTWSDWVDVNTTLSIENPVPVSSEQRYASVDRTEWIVAGPSDDTVRYFRQWNVRVILIGLNPAHTPTLRSARFGASVAAFPWDDWSDWVDHEATVSVDPLLMVGSRERYRAEGETRWIVTSAATHTVRYIRQFMPSVALVGTDDNHTVDAIVYADGRTQVFRGVRHAWTDWVDFGGRIAFSSETTGRPPRVTLDPTTFEVRSAFDARIRYAGPGAAEPNYKPLISLIYVAVIVTAGAVTAFRRPLDVYILPSRSKRLLHGGRTVARFRLMRIEDPTRKLRKDRHTTFLAIVLPFAAVETAVGILSLLTGVLSVPQGGTWFSLGLIVNTMLLGASAASDLVVVRRGYDSRRQPPSGPRAK